MLQLYCVMYNPVYLVVRSILLFFIHMGVENTYFDDTVTGLKPS